VAEFRNN